MIENDRVDDFGAGSYLHATADAALGDVGFLPKFDVFQDRAVGADLLDDGGQTLVVGHLILLVFLNR